MIGEQGAVKIFVKDKDKGWILSQYRIRLSPGRSIDYVMYFNMAKNAYGGNIYLDIVGSNFRDRFDGV